MRIAIIDGQVNDKIVTHKIVRYKVENREVKLDDKVIEHISHGTMVSQIISQYGIVDEIDVLEILDNSEKGSIQDLIQALKWCLEQDIDIINLSIGSTSEDDFHKIKVLCQSLNRQGKIIFAAENNDGIKSAPSIFNEVISVKRIKLHNIMIYDSRNKRILISGENWLKFKDGGCTKSQNSNSYACAFATSVISRKGKNIIDDKYQKRYKIVWTR